MTDGNYTLYSTESCTRCPLAKKSMERAGVTYSEVKLDSPDHAERLEALREQGISSVPVVETPDGRLLTNLATISAEFRAAA